MSSSRYVFKVNEFRDKEKIIPFLERNYYRHEPLQLMYLAKHVERISSADRRGLASYLYKSHEVLLANSICFTIHKRLNDELVAMLLMHVEENPLFKKENPEERPDRIQDEEDFTLYETMKHLPSNSPMVNDVFRNVKFAALEEVKIFEKYLGSWKIANIMVLCVGEPYRCQGLASRLISKAVEWAKKSDIDVVYGLFTSNFAQKAAERSNLKRIKDMDLMSFKNELEMPIFEGMEPRSISIMALRLKENTFTI